MDNLKIEKINKILEINRLARLNYLIRRAEGRTLIKHIPLELQKKRGRKVKDINSYEIFNFKLTPIRKTRGRPPKNLSIEVI